MFWFVSKKSCLLTNEFIPEKENKFVSEYQRSFSFLFVNYSNKYSVIQEPVVALGLVMKTV